MTAQLNAKQIAEIKALLATVGLTVRKAPKTAGPVDYSNEGRPGKRPSWWHGNGSGRTRKMVAKYGYFKDARGVYDYRKINPAYCCRTNHPRAIAAYYALTVNYMPTETLQITYQPN